MVDLVRHIQSYTVCTPGNGMVRLRIGGFPAEALWKHSLLYSATATTDANAVAVDRVLRGGMECLQSWKKILQPGRLTSSLLSTPGMPNATESVSQRERQGKRVREGAAREGIFLARQTGSGEMINTMPSSSRSLDRTSY